jgi:hypothetical protein
MGTTYFPLPEDVAEVVALVNAGQPGTNLAFLVEDGALYLFGGDQSCYFADTLAEGQAFLAGAFYAAFRGASRERIAAQCPPSSRQPPTEMQDQLNAIVEEIPFREWLLQARAMNPYSLPSIGFPVLAQVDDMVRLLNARGRWRLALSSAEGRCAVREQGQLLFHAGLDRECFAFVAACFVDTFGGQGIDDIVESVAPGVSNRRRLDELRARFYAEFDAGTWHPDSTVDRELEQLRAQSVAGIFQGRPLKELLPAGEHDDGSGAA